MSKIKVSKHTPELYYRKAGLDYGDGLIYGDDGKTLAIVPHNNDIGYLFAAAPELLRYLKIAEEVLRVCGNDTTEIKTAISKAEGGK